MGTSTALRTSAEISQREEQDRAGRGGKMWQRGKGRKIIIWSLLFAPDVADSVDLITTDSQDRENLKDPLH